MSTATLLDKLNAKLQRSDIPQFAPGDTIRVHVRIKEGDKERLQAFEGTVIAKSAGPQPSFTVRRDRFLLPGRTTKIGRPCCIAFLVAWTSAASRAAGLDVFG